MSDNQNTEEKLPAWRYGTSLGDIFDRNLILLYVIGTVVATVFMALGG